MGSAGGGGVGGGGGGAGSGSGGSSGGVGAGSSPVDVPVGSSDDVVVSWASAIVSRNNKSIAITSASLLTGRPALDRALVEVALERHVHALEVRRDESDDEVLGDR